MSGSVLLFVAVAAVVGLALALCRRVGGSRAALAVFLAGCLGYGLLLLQDVAREQILEAVGLLAATWAIGWALRYRGLSSGSAVLYWFGIAGNVMGAFLLHAAYGPWTMLLVVNAVIFLTQVRAGLARPAVVDVLPFVLFVPRNLAGPVVGYRSFTRRMRSGSNVPGHGNFAEIGLIYIAVGLAKTLLFGAELEFYIAPVFTAASGGTIIGGTDAWAATIANYLQLYFELSGACDIAAGALLVAGMRVPTSFYGPIAATGVASFWRRFHRTAVAFVRVYLYRPLRGGGLIPRPVAATAALIAVGLWLAPSSLGLVWALAQSAAMLIETTARRLTKSAPSWAVRVPGWIATQAFMALTSLLLRVPTPEGVGSLLRGLAGKAGFALPAAMGEFFTNKERQYFVFTQDPLIASHALGLMNVVLLSAIGFAAALVGPNLEAASRRWRRAYFVAVIYFVLGFTVQQAPMLVSFHGVHL